MGAAPGDTAASPPEALVSVLRKAGWAPEYPDGVGGLCCGMAFHSRGFAGAAAEKAAEMERALLRASDGGRAPVVCDTSPCALSIRDACADPRLRVYEPLGFIREHCADQLAWRRVRDRVAVHVPCSSKKMKLAPAFADLAARCAGEVVDSNVPCCGMAGDRGMRYPELTAGSLAHLEHAGCDEGYSTSRTCEMGLSQHSGKHWRSLVTLIDEATAELPKGRPAAASA